MANTPRRVVLGALALLPALAMAPLARADVTTSAASAFITQAGNQLLGVINGPDSTAQKAAALRGIVENIVAVDQVGQFVLGRYTNVATPAQKTEYMQLFHDLLAYNITAQIRADKGITFKVNNAQPQPGGTVLVDTTVNRPSAAPTDVGWVVQDVSGSPKIVDVVVEGTSLRVTERSDYASVIVSNGGQVSALLAAMQKQVAHVKSLSQ
jgi:phospholipid transport system substrate-binding protein